MPLEPIESKDLDLGAKFGNHPEKAGTAPNQNESEKVPEQVSEMASAEKDSAYQAILSKVQTQNPPVSSGNVTDDAKAVAEKQDAESQITHLVEMASQKGVPHAVSVARHLENNYILDSFHDRLLSQELHDALLKKGLIKEL